MKIIENINVQQEKLSSGLSVALRICRQINKSPDEEDIVDFSHAKFVTPTFTMSVLIYIEKSGKNICLDHVEGYLSSVCLDKFGVNSGAMRKSEFAAYLEQFVQKRYIPLIKFPATNDRIEDKNSIMSVIESMIVRQAGLRQNIISGIKYMLGEIVDNISEHSKSEYGYILAQCYPTSRCIDVCIGDAGITLLGSYSQIPKWDIDSDGEAMRAANSGISAKNLPDAENRGYGISTTKKMLVDGMGGQYMMVSGDTVYVKTKAGSGYFELPYGIRFEGTIVALRIPYWNEDFEYVNYIE